VMAKEQPEQSTFTAEETTTQMLWWLTQTRDMVAAAVAGFPAPVVDFPPRGNVDHAMLAGALYALTALCAMGEVGADNLTEVIERITAMQPTTTEDNQQ